MGTGESLTLPGCLQEGLQGYMGFPAATPTPRSKEATRSEHLPVRDLESDPGNRSMEDSRASVGTGQIECWNEAVLSVRIMS